jgi:hypothetical protein
MSLQTTTPDYQQAVSKRFATVRAKYAYEGFQFYRVRQPGLPIARYFCIRNRLEEEFATLADALVWLDQHKVRKAALEAGDAK